MRSTIKRFGVILATLLMITSCGGNDNAASPSKTAEAPGLSESEAADIATEAYVYAYPLVSVEYTRRGLTNVQSDDAVVLAQRQEAVDPQRNVAHSAGQTGSVSATCAARTRTRCLAPGP